MLLPSSLTSHVMDCGSSSCESNLESKPTTSLPLQRGEPRAHVRTAPSPQFSSRDELLVFFTLDLMVVLGVRFFLAAPSLPSERLF